MSNLCKYFYCLTHYILQDLMAKETLRPVSVSLGTNAQSITAQYLCNTYATYMLHTQHLNNAKSGKTVQHAQ